MAAHGVIIHGSWLLTTKEAPLSREAGTNIMCSKRRCLTMSIADSKKVLGLVLDALAPQRVVQVGED
eukprot:232431-Alexandrium_andersonii.AAC.1